MSNRPITGGRRLTGVPRTAVTRNGQVTTGAVGVGLSQDMDVVDRPITREGMLSVQQQSDQKHERKYKDETFWITKLRQKNDALKNEIESLENECNTLRDDSDQAERLNKQHEKLKAEVEALHNTFNDLNLAVDRLQSASVDDQLGEMEQEIKKLTQENKDRRSRNDSILKQKIDIEEKVHTLRRTMDESLSKFDVKLKENPRLRKEFYNLKTEEQSLDQTIRQLKGELSQLESKYNNQISAMQTDESKRRYLMKLNHKKEQLDELHTIKRQISALENEGAEEKESMNKLLAEVKEMKEEKKVIAEQNNGLQMNLNQQLKKLNAFTGDVAQQYKALKEKDALLQQFLNDFPESKMQLTQSMKKLQEMNVELLDHISTNISDKENIPSMDHLANMRSNLQWKKEEYNRSAATLDGLKRDLEKRRTEFSSMENLDEKLARDLQERQRDIHRMTDELRVFSDLEQLEANYKKLFGDMADYKVSGGALRDAMKRQMNSISRSNTHAVKRLQNNPVYDALSDLENKIKKLEQTNYSLREYIVTKGAETDYSELKSDSSDLVAALNKLIVEKHSPQADVLWRQ